MDQDKKDYLSTIYFDENHIAGFSRLKTLYDFVKQDGQYAFTKKELKNWLENQEIYSTHTELRRAKHFSPVVAPYNRYMYDIDSTFLKGYGRYKNFIIAVDPFSKKIGACAVINLKSDNVKKALEDIFDEMGDPEMIRCDRGKEHVNASIATMLKNRRIKHFYANPPNKANYAERGIRTIRNYLFRAMQYKGRKDWEKILANIVKTYNDKTHSMINMSPNEASNPDNAAEVWFKTKHSNILKGQVPKAYKYSINAPVRISYIKNPFQKDFNEKNSTQIYFVSSRYMSNNVRRYRLKTLDNTAIDGSYTEHEIVSAGDDDQADREYRIERIVRRRHINGRLHYLIRWLGYGPQYDSWIAADTVRNFQ